jgi:hypothetical protein
MNKVSEVDTKGRYDVGFFVFHEKTTFIYEIFIDLQVGLL